MNVNERELYGFGIPMDSEFGKIRFLTYVEYLQLLPELSLISQNTLHIYYLYLKRFKSLKLVGEEKVSIEESLEDLKNQPLYNIVKSDKSFEGTYKKIFNIVLEDKSQVKEILNNEENFMKMRQYVMDMNMLTEDEVNPNPEIQKGLERSKRAKQQESEKQTVNDIVSSIVVGAGILPQDVAHMTVLQVYSTYYRIGQFQNYSTSTLFATVAEKVSIESWNKHIDLWGRQSHAVEYKKFKETTGRMLDD